MQFMRSNNDSSLFAYTKKRKNRQISARILGNGGNNTFVLRFVRMHINSIIFNDVIYLSHGRYIATCVMCAYECELILGLCMRRKSIEPNLIRSRAVQEHTMTLISNFCNNISAINNRFQE